jgi:hypothetical protein|eukprot:scaffold107_cov269-Chaetoceros_neogracile.AAC.37
MSSITTTLCVNNQQQHLHRVMTFTSCSSADENLHSKNISAFQMALDKVSKCNATVLNAEILSSSRTKVDATAAFCLITLCKVLDNILLERQYNPKTRSIKLGNKLFHDRVGKVPGGGKIALN